ncbi:asparagine synthase B [Mesoterricola sediminis]|uniref:asparagine synthase (glutamine-hydrolyzing) n=1 Tax=Mesoterricola sediminis TaxID=2927980 RepID=A0AA48KHM5_9BACT|nr:asparagine synthase B [Mesoterricola sediminis]BDU78518.1 asparagine synthase B [Mesoterricola sediminis]
MCGILAILDIDPARSHPAELRRQALAMARKLRHRGPDWSGIRSDGRAILAHERLSIVDVEHGAQPLEDVRTGCLLTVNGEIYNHQELRRGLRDAHLFQTRSDCEVILYLYEEDSPRAFLNRMNGIFAFVLYDPRRDTWLIARDPLGVVPLYLGWDRNENLYAASELKALAGTCERIQEFPPGCYLLGSEREKGFQRYYTPAWAEPGHVPDRPADPTAIREALQAAVHRQLMCDVPYGLLISGGVDSSIIAAVAAQYREARVEEEDRGPSWWPRIHSFAVGLEGAPDLAPARRVAEHIGAIHHEIHFTVQEGLDALSDVIYHLETFDITTVRASTPMFLMMRKIRAMGIKMVLSGEGADEIFGGYLYFHKAPSGAALHEETVRKLSKLHLYDCLRANKSAAAWSVEARVPFLDREFLDVAMAMDPAAKLPRNTASGMEKHLLREAFDGWIPDEVLWRQKEQFSDGVGYRWIDSLKAHAEIEVTDGMMRGAAERFPVKTPLTKEAYLYRQIFESHFPMATAVNCVPFEASVACSTPAALAWDPSFAGRADPSGRAVAGVHRDALG